jgi:hypothetical protein
LPNTEPRYGHRNRLTLPIDFVAAEGSAML